MKTLLLGAMLVASAAFTQLKTDPETQTGLFTGDHFKISLRYNVDYERYEVYAQATFSRASFPLGSSQISIALPRHVANQSLNITSTTANWTDYSVVYAPAAAPEVDIHGINSLGKVIDFQQNTPFMLFAFRLKEGYVDGVRLFVNGKDPGSMKPGMMGGDFSNTLQDHKSTEFYQPDFDEQAVAQLAKEAEAAGAPSVMVYPNPVTGDHFSVTARQFQTGKRVKISLLSGTGVELLTFDEEASRLVDYQVRVPRQLSGQAYLRVEPAMPESASRAIYKKVLILN